MCVSADASRQVVQRPPTRPSSTRHAGWEENMTRVCVFVLARARAPLAGGQFYAWVENLAGTLFIFSLIGRDLCTPALCCDETFVCLVFLAGATIFNFCFDVDSCVFASVKVYRYDGGIM